jgi:tungstate transport system substrate-binding protein
MNSIPHCGRNAPPALPRAALLVREYRVLETALLGALIALILLGGSARADERSAKVGVPTEPLFELVQALAPTFKEDTGIGVTASKVASGQQSTDLDAAIVPDAWTGEIGPPEAERQPVFVGDRILIGSRAERARVRGYRDIKSAFRAIALARGTFVSSSPELGARQLELSLWDSLGVNVQSRLTWYVEVNGDEAAVLSGAGDLGAYLLVERATYAALRNKRGLELLVAGDPLLKTTYSSVLLRRESQTGRAWHDWLGTARGQAAIAAFRLNGMETFKPLQGALQPPNARPS